MIKPSKLPQGAKGKTAEPGFARGKCFPPLVLRTTFPSASGGTITRRIFFLISYAERSIVKTSPSGVASERDL